VTRENIEQFLDHYLNSLASGDMSEVAIAPDITFRGSYAGRVSGADEVRGLLSGAARAFQGLKLHRGPRLIDGDQAVQLFDLELQDGTLVSFADLFRFADGKLAHLDAVFDTRPILWMFGGSAEQA
jgi:hypothetical protein